MTPPDFTCPGVPLMNLLEVVGVKLSHFDTEPGDVPVNRRGSKSSGKFEQAPPYGFRHWREFQGLVRNFKQELQLRPDATERRFEYINSAAPQRAVHESAREGPIRERLTAPIIKV